MGKSNAIDHTDIMQTSFFGGQSRNKVCPASELHAKISQAVICVYIHEFCIKALQLRNHCSAVVMQLAQRWKRNAYIWKIFPR